MAIEAEARELQTVIRKIQACRRALAGYDRQKERHGRKRTIGCSGYIRSGLGCSTDVEKFDVVPRQIAGCQKSIDEGGFERACRKGDLLALEIGRTANVAVRRHQQSDVIPLYETGKGFHGQALRTRNDHGRERGVTDVIFAVPDDLHRRDRTVAIVKRDIKIVFLE